MHPFADPYAIPSKPAVRTFDPIDAMNLVDGISDAICRIWRRDTLAITSSSTPRVRDPQTHELKEGPRTAQNFYYWTMDRQKSGGLVKRIHISWGQHAVEVAAVYHEYFTAGITRVPTLITTTLDKSKIAVQGPHDKKGTTKYRLVEDVKSTPLKGMYLPELKFRFLED